MTPAAAISRVDTLPQPLDAHSLEPLAQKVMAATQSCWSCTSCLTSELNALHPRDLKGLIDMIILDLEPKEMDRLAQLLPLEALQNAVRTQYPWHVSALRSAQGMYSEAKHFIETTESAISPTLRTRLSSLLTSMIAVLESVLNAFGVADFFKPAENTTSAEFKAHKIMMLLSLFTMLSTMLVPILGAEFAATILGGTMLTISALSLIYPYIKPASAKLPRAENWTQQFLEGNLLTSGGRKGTIDEIARTLIASKLAKTHVMMIGKTGIGKTETAKALVEAVARGDYPELKDKEIHYINTADLLGSTEMFSNANKILSQISEAMGKHREHYILIFDEIHMACQKKENSVLSEQLKTLLDPGKQNFPYVIGITTEEEFLREIYVNNPAFARRFKCITLDNTEDPETLKILNNVFLKKAPKIFLEPGVLPSLLQQTKAAFGLGAAQPASSLKILSQCIKRIESPQRSPLQRRVDELRGSIQQIYSQRAVGHGNGIRLHNVEFNEAPLLKQLHQLEANLAAETQALAALERNRERLAAVKKEVYRSALAIASKASDVLPSEPELNEFLLRSHFLAPLLEGNIRAMAHQLQVKTVLDATLVNEVIEEEIANDRKALAAIERGKEQISSRAGV